MSSFNPLLKGRRKGATGLEDFKLKLQELWVKTLMNTANQITERSVRQILYSKAAQPNPRAAGCPAYAFGLARRKRTA